VTEESTISVAIDKIIEEAGALHGITSFLDDLIDSHGDGRFLGHVGDDSKELTGIALGARNGG
jgi:hypothetical protein